MRTLFVAILMVLLPAVALAQTAPPKQIEESVSTAEAAPSSDLLDAAFHARAGISLASEIAQYRTEQADGTVAMLRASEEGSTPESEKPSTAEEQPTDEEMAKLEADLDRPNDVKVSPQLEQHRLKVMALVDDVREWDALDSAAAEVEDLWATFKAARRARLAAPGEGMFELAPYVDAPEWKQAITLLEENKCKDALKLAEKVAKDSKEPGVKYAIARMQLCGGQTAEGKATLKTLAEGKDVVAYLAKLRLGAKGLDDMGRTEGMYLSQKLNKAKRKARVNVDGALKDLDSLHEQMTSNWDKYRIRMTQAEILEAAKRIDEAGEAYLAIYRKTRGWKVNSAIEDRIERLERRHKKKFLTYGERIDRMRHLVSRGKYRQAKKVSIENAKIRRVKGREIRGWARYRMALQAEREKKRDKANKLFAEAEKMVRDSEVRPRLYFGWARSLRRTNKDSTAIELYGRLCKEYPEHHLCDDALYEAGRLLQFQNKHKLAQENFDKVIENHKDSEFMADALWRSAFSHYLNGNYDKSNERLAAILKDHADLKDESELTMGLKARYWTAMNHLGAGRKDVAKAAFQDTINNGRLTWYGQLAVARMRQQGWSPRLDLPTGKLRKDDLENLELLNVPESDRLQVAAEYVRIGLLKDALSELRDQIAIHPVPEGAHRMLGAVYLAQGDAANAHWLMKKHIAEAGPNAESLRDWGTAFPLNYMNLSKTYGEKAGVSPFLVQSIMRQESGFRPTVKSWAGAYGLMQMMPRSANWTSKMFLGGKRYSRSALKKPEINVEIGSMYIRIHTAHTHNSVPLALAGYNAGAGALESWHRRYGDRDLDAFVESITYQEARGYVRKVFTTYTAYTYLYGGKLPELDLTVPKKLRRFGELPEKNPRISMLH